MSRNRTRCACGREEEEARCANYRRVNDITQGDDRNGARLQLFDRCCCVSIIRMASEK